MTAAAAARVGDPVAAIDTPALVVDLDAMEANLAAMAAFAKRHGVRLRPHAKMHKCAAIALLQMQAGAVGACVQKTAEAEALAAAGVTDIVITNEVIGAAKLARVAALARRVRLGICVDSAVGIDMLAVAFDGAVDSAIDVYVEVDVGQGRCGVAPAAAGAVAHRVCSHTRDDGSGLRFAGLQAYHGGAQHVRSAGDREGASRHAAAQARAAIASVTASGLRCPLVTGGGTGTFAFDVEAGVWGELQAGSYLFMDRDYADNQTDEGIAPRFAHALFVKSAAMSVGAAHAVVDAGHKAHAIDSGLPRVWGRPLAVGACSDEHATLRPLPGGTADDLPALGETVWLVPGHCDPTVNLHDAIVAVRGGLDAGVVEAVWPVDARGCLS